MDDARILHGGELSFGENQLVRIQAAGFGKNQWARTSEKVVADWMARQRWLENRRRVAENLLVGHVVGQEKIMMA